MADASLVVDDSVYQVIDLHREWLIDPKHGRRADLSRADLTHRDLSDADLRQAIISAADLTGAIFKRALLQDADLFAANLTGADMSHADMSRSILRGAILKDANLNHTTLNDADFRGGTILTTDGEVEGANETDLTNCNLDFAMLARAEMTGANLEGTSFVGAHLRGAKLAGAKLVDTNFSDADLSEANLSETHIERANFVGSSLVGATLARANVTEANFMNADLKGVEMKDVDLSSSLLAGTSLTLTVADLRPHVRRAFHDHEKWITTNGKDGRRADLEQEDLSYVNLAGHNLSAIVLHQAKLLEANMSDCVFMMTVSLRRRFAACKHGRIDLRWRQFDRRQPGRRKSRRRTTTADRDEGQRREPDRPSHKNHARQSEPHGCEAGEYRSGIVQLGGRSVQLGG